MPRYAARDASSNHLPGSASQDLPPRDPAMPESAMIRGVLLMLGALLAGYVCYLALLFVQQRSVMFPGASMYWDGVGQALPARAEVASIPASFGHVQGVLLRARQPPGADGRAPAALYF